MSPARRPAPRTSLRGIVLLGPPGAGKGTQAALLAARLRLKHISTGEILREEVQRGTELGEAARDYMDRGELVPDDLIIEMLRGRLDGNFLLDGFPRTTRQAEALERIAAIDRVLSICLSEEETVRRLAARRVCAECGQNYNLASNPPRVAGVCDACGGRLIQRDDDTPEVIRRRYRVYEAETAPLHEFYRQRGLLVEVEGADAIEEVFQEALRLLAPAK
jgi:adenylate kinase